jgi:hypothetical protein
MQSCNTKTLPMQYLEVGEVKQNPVLCLHYSTLCATKIKCFMFSKSNIRSDIVNWHSDFKFPCSNLTVSKQLYLQKAHTLQAFLLCKVHQSHMKNTNYCVSPWKSCFQDLTFVIRCPQSLSPCRDKGVPWLKLRDLEHRIILLKMPSLENSPFKGRQLFIFCICKSYTLRNKNMEIMCFLQRQLFAYSQIGTRNF